MGNYLDQEQAINCPWLSFKEIMTILPICETTAKKIVHDIVEEMKANNEFYFNTKPRRVPTRKIVEKYNIDVNLIRREALKIKNC